MHPCLVFRQKGRLLAVLFGAQVQGAQLTAQAFYCPQRVRAGTVVQHEKRKFVLPSLNPATETAGGSGFYWKPVVLDGQAL